MRKESKPRLSSQCDPQIACVDFADPCQGRSCVPVPTNCAPEKVTKSSDGCCYECGDVCAGATCPTETCTPPLELRKGATAADPNGCCSVRLVGVACAARSESSAAQHCTDICPTHPCKAVEPSSTLVRSRCMFVG